MPSEPLSRNAAAFREALIAWYDANARDLPWRREPSTYKTVVSEFMLQQTQVKTVLPYFAAWLEAYPDFASLAAASEEQVLKSWEGLGYYSRARNLHKLAREVAAIPPGQLPTDAKSWLKFPGVGPYAAAAICSISFSDPSAVVDGNVVRILARLTADESDYKTSTDAAKSYRGLVQELLNLERPGDHNQAMMELGATVCHKQSPTCLLCPVQSHCQAQALGIAETLPRLAKTKFKEVTVNRAWIQSEHGILLHKIPADAKRMKGLHELPDLAQLGIPVPKGKPTLTRKRGITKYRITERIHALPPGKLPSKLPEHHVWVAPAALQRLPFSGPHRRWVTELVEASGH
ncbi:A/G-specific adenine glycosylase [Pelagicoccus sp. SDUM812005]|uniref:A/G-specific adenine glycosylase n=1 Tax=Pelagicoccus sp. SDUM812005 TaxID=3041257 RepID=UPI00280C4C6D|nr:A/G-specific adenine glycosylase [Pelagicoccus sp. SDUM812005]MDQ8179054.1 A/G-specific adenine glycosylase [Pelagicoccus sp. SDUM812005]